MPIRFKMQRGFSLIEVLITTAVVTVVMLAFMQMTSNNLKGMKGVQDASDLNAIGNTLQQIMSSDSACTANLALAATPLQFDTTPLPAAPYYPTPLQTVNPANGKAILPEIDYPMPAPSPATGYVPNPGNPLIVLKDSSGQPGNYAGWVVDQMGIQVQGTPAPNQYYITVEVSFKKKTDAHGNPLSLGSQTALRQTTALTVTTTPVAGNLVKVIGCGGASAIHHNGYSANNYANNCSNPVINIANPAIGQPMTLIVSANTYANHGTYVDSSLVFSSGAGGSPPGSPAVYNASVDGTGNVKTAQISTGYSDIWNTPVIPVGVNLVSGGAQGCAQTTLRVDAIY